MIKKIFQDIYKHIRSAIDANETVLPFIVAIIIVGGLVYVTNIKGSEPEWCKIGEKVSILPANLEGTPENLLLEIKGTTTYKDKEVCKAENKKEDGVLTQYFTKNNDYISFVIKDSYGNVTNEVEINQSNVADESDTDTDNIAYIDTPVSAQGNETDDTSYNGTDENNISYLPFPVPAQDTYNETDAEAYNETGQ